MLCPIAGRSELDQHSIIARCVWLGCAIPTPNILWLLSHRNINYYKFLWGIRTWYRLYLCIGWSSRVFLWVDSAPLILDRVGLSWTECDTIYVSSSLERSHQNSASSLSYYWVDNLTRAWATRCKYQNSKIWILLKFERPLINPRRHADFMSY